MISDINHIFQLIILFILKFSTNLRPAFGSNMAQVTAADQPPVDRSYPRPDRAALYSTAVIRATNLIKSGLIAFTVLGLCACTAEAPAPGVSAEPLRVMTFNIRFDNPDDGQDAWPHRRGAVASLIQFYEPDVLGTQEVLLNQYQQLQEDLPDYATYGVGRNDGKMDGEFIPLFYRRDRFRLIDSGSFWLSETPGSPSVGWDAALPRVASWLRLEDLQTGLPLLAMNVHFDHIGETARLQSAALIREWLLENRQDAEPLVLIGDLNATPSSPPLQELTRGDFLINTISVSETPPFGPPGTGTRFDILRADAEPIDHIFAVGRFRVLRHGVITQHNAGRLPSDHYPVLADIIFNAPN